MNIKKEQVRISIKCCQLVMVRDNQLTDLQRQVDLLRRIKEFKRSWDDMVAVSLSGSDSGGGGGLAVCTAGRARGNMPVAFLHKMLIVRVKENKRLPRK